MLKEGVYWWFLFGDTGAIREALVVDSSLLSPSNP